MSVKKFKNLFSKLNSELITKWNTHCKADYYWIAMFKTSVLNLAVLKLSKFSHQDRTADQSMMTVVSIHFWIIIVKTNKLANRQNFKLLSYNYEVW